MKKLLSVLLSGALIASLAVLPTAAAQSSTGEAADDWAVELVNTAIRRNLMPAQLAGRDLRENITRTQFAALAVRLYEAMGGRFSALSQNSPFVDTSDPDVVKAYHLGIVSGLTEDTFGGDELVTREQAATMLTALYQKVNEGSKKAFLLWIASQKRDDETDNDTDLTGKEAVDVLGGIYNKLNGAADAREADAFADDGDISEWAKDGVYFMASNKIVSGIGNNRFDPQANAQGQAALIMAVQMLERLG